MKTLTQRIRDKRRGAAMLVVMLVLLVVTATATFAIHSTTIELRASGYARQRMQTRYLAEGALASTISMVEQTGGPQPLREAIERSTVVTGGSTRQLAPEEPTMAATSGNHRIELSEFAGSANLVGAPLDTNVGSESLGGGMGYTPTFVVDVNDAYAYPGTVAGQRSDGGGMLEYIVTTYTARARTVPPADAYSPTQATAAPTMRRGYHETITNARAIGISGPTARRTR